jgi:hypothetical protein
VNGGGDISIENVTRTSIDTAIICKSRYSVTDWSRSTSRFREMAPPWLRVCLSLGISAGTRTTADPNARVGEGVGRRVRRVTLCREDTSEEEGATK